MIYGDGAKPHHVVCNFARRPTGPCHYCDKYYRNDELRRKASTVTDEELIAHLERAATQGDSDGLIAGYMLAAAELIKTLKARVAELEAK